MLRILFALPLLLLAACQCSQPVPDAAEDDNFERVFIATNLAEADLPGYSDADIDAMLEEIADGFGTGMPYGPYVSPAVAFHCAYESNWTYLFADDAVLQRNLESAVRVGIPFRVALVGGSRTGTDCDDEPLPCHFKTAHDGWLQQDEEGLYTEPIPGAMDPPYVSLSRYHTSYYSAKTYVLRQAVRDILQWVQADSARQELFLGFSKDAETYVPRPSGLTLDGPALAEFEAWRTQTGIYAANTAVLLLDDHPGITGVRDVEQFGGGLAPEAKTIVSEDPESPWAIAVLENTVVPDGTVFDYTVTGGSNEGSTFQARSWTFFDDPELDGGEGIQVYVDDDDERYEAFLNAMVDHHVQDVVETILQVFDEVGFETDPERRRNYVWTYEVAGGNWTHLDLDALLPDAYNDYIEIAQTRAPLLPDEDGNWSSVAQVHGASLGLSLHGEAAFHPDILGAARDQAVLAGAQWGLMEWDPGGDDPENIDRWLDSLELARVYGPRWITLRDWSIIADGNEAAREALGTFMAENGDIPPIDWTELEAR